jgi:type IV secretion system protein VirD4
LGPPILVTRAGRIYQPFAWISWGWRYSTARDERIRKPFFEGEMIVVAGSLLSVGIFFVVANRRTRTLSASAEDLHGSARWAEKADIRETGLLDAQRGVYVGAWCAEGSGHLNYLRHNGPEHILAFAPTRSGKGVGLVIPTLLAWDESAVIYDIKGENWGKDGRLSPGPRASLFQVFARRREGKLAIQPAQRGSSVHAA